MGAQRPEPVVVHPRRRLSSSSPESALRSSRTAASTSSSARNSNFDHNSTHKTNVHGHRPVEARKAASPAPQAAPELHPQRPASPASSEASFDDEILLVAHRPRPPPSLSAAEPPATSSPAVREPFEAPGPAIASSSATAFAPHPRWSVDRLDPPAAPRSLSDKAKGKLPLEREHAVESHKRSASPRTSPRTKKRRLDATFDGVEIPVASASSSPVPAEPGPHPVHRRWASGSSVASARVASTAPEDDEAAAAVERRRSSRLPVVVAQPPRPHPATSADVAASRTVVSPRETSNCGRASSLPSAPTSTRLGVTLRDVVPARSRPSSAVAYTGIAAPVGDILERNFPSRPPQHPLNALRLRTPPLDPPPRFVCNPAYEPAAALGWISGAVSKKRAPPRPVPRLRTNVPPAAAAAAAAAPAPVASFAGEVGQRRSARAKVPAQPACSIYPSATDRVAALASSTSASASSSRASSASSEDPRTRTAPVSTRAAPAALAQPVRRKPLLAQLRTRYAFLAEDNCAPFRADNSCDGINPEPCSFEWDSYELRAAVRAEGWPPWRDEDLEMVRDAGEAADLILSAHAGDEGARDVVRSACRLVPWRYRDLDDALGSASNAPTRWATCDWRMVQQQQLELGETVDVTRVRGGPQTFLDAVGGDLDLDLVEAGDALSPFSSPSRATTSPRKRGSAITDVPPTTPRPLVAVDGEPDMLHDPFRERGSSAAASRPLVFRESHTSSAAVADPRPARSARRALTDEPCDAPAPAASRPSSGRPAGPARRSARVTDAEGPRSRAQRRSSTRGHLLKAALPPSSKLVPKSVRLREARTAKVEESPPSGSTARRREKEPSSTSDSDSDDAPSVAERKSAQPSPQPSRSGRAARPSRTSSAKLPAAVKKSLSSDSDSDPDEQPPQTAPATRPKERVVYLGLRVGGDAAGLVQGQSADLRVPSPPLIYENGGLSSAQLLAAAARSLSSISDSDSDAASSAAVQVALPSPPKPLKPGFTRCDWDGCPNPVYKSTTATSDELHVVNYHDTTCIVTYQRPYRTTRLERDEHGLFACPWCWHKIKNATVAQSHAYGRKSCPGPPVADQDKSPTGTLSSAD
ncbi:uncharacterized protein RHOBADRAFT_51692 [Rhodotorula graminis WP1]|uniref:Uncharacterized protein n=1 Tax=Rhodotorula graminis (strain WP1) TaxID=578459 RepID=A0A194SBA1_RHOGW|nr:uncharacterized protein RHOBADRAFT_51692 [Rhodotorula graminis WP1]KPV76686.1 hypothetical protein RHOBADRAFT_51692 [Rhodotorula graminis WP1]